MNRFLTIFLSLQLCIIPAFAFAAPTITPLKKGDKAPYAGSLLNNEALAKIQVESQAAKAKCELEYSYLKMRGQLECDLKTNKLKIDLDTSNKRYSAIIPIKDKEIRRLQDIALDADKSSAYKWWLAGGVIVGIVITVGAFLLAAQVQKVN